MPVVLAILAAGLALLASAASGRETPPGPPPKAGEAPKRPAKAGRRMGSQDLFEAGKKARDAELIVEAKEREARESEIDRAVDRRMKAERKTAPPAPKPDPPKEDAA